MKKFNSDSLGIMRMLILSAILAVMTICAIAQEKQPNLMVLTRVDGERVFVDIKELSDITFENEDASTYVQLWENGPRWAKKNIGASSETDAGSYFWWGDIDGHAKDDQPTFNYVHHNIGITSYNGDNVKDYYVNGKLPSTKDAATALVGKAYRMPTKEDFNELLEKCNAKWYYRGNSEFNGVAGLKLTSKMEGYTDRYIFLPAAGFGNQKVIIYENAVGRYWTSTSHKQKQAIAIIITSSSNIGIEHNDVFMGYSIRPIADF